MHPVLAKTFGGLSAPYYFRHFLFGVAMTAFVYSMVTHDHRPLGLSTLLLLAVNTVLYPYSRFVYESLVNFIMGENVFFASAILILAMKVATMMACWAFGMLIAPVGLIYLFFYHSRTAP